MSEVFKQRVLQFGARVSKRIGLRGLLYLPEGYRDSGSKRWPLLMFLHGAGERGNNLKSVARHGPPKLAARGRQFPFIIVSPQCPHGQTWDEAALLAFLDHVTARCRVDRGRVYLTGLSMGGYATWELGTRYPERFAAIAPVCGGGSAANVLIAPRAKSRALRSLAVWAFHGARDDVVPPAESKVMVAAVRKAGCREVRLTIYPGVAHDSHTRTYDNPELYEWFLAHRRART